MRNSMYGRGGASSLVLGGRDRVGNTLYVFCYG